jgi:hypothetical protein
MDSHQKRLLAERQDFENVLPKEGHDHGRAYAKHAKYRDLILVKKYGESLEEGTPADAVALACFVCQADQTDADTREWVQANLSKAWSGEEAYVRGFIQGAIEVIEEINSLSTPKN